MSKVLYTIVIKLVKLNRITVIRPYTIINRGCLINLFKGITNTLKSLNLSLILDYIFLSKKEKKSINQNIVYLFKNLEDITDNPKE